jgi:hypothetical protein
MDPPDTRAYVEHRLRLVGWQDNPQFEPEVFDEIYAFSGGIPRRINSLCDRVLLSGFLSGKHNFSAEDVREVAIEISQETHGSSRLVASATEPKKDGPNGVDLGLDVPSISNLRLMPKLRPTPHSSPASGQPARIA